jgi:hypothetical protein
MKLPLSLIVGSAAAGLTAATAFGQNTYQPGSSSSKTTVKDPSLSSATTPSASQGGEFFQAKNLIGTKAKDSAGQSVGDIKDLLFNPQTGEMFAAFDASGSRYSLVPWQVLNINRTEGGKEQITLNVSKSELEAGPTVPRNDWQQLASSTFTHNIYAHHNVQPKLPMGGTGTSSIGGSSSESSSSVKDVTKPQN